MTEKQAKEAGYDIKVGKFHTRPVARQVLPDKRWFCELIFDSKYGELLGGHMVGGNVTEIVAELVVAKRLEITGHELMKSIHPHPTMSEAIMEAAAAAYDEVIHL